MEPGPTPDPHAAGSSEGASEKPQEPRSGPAPPRRLPEGREEFCREVTRRLDLLDREIRALSRATPDDAAAARALLSQLEMVLRLRLETARQLAADRWPAARREIVEMWRRFRAEFERQALHAERSYTAAGRAREGEGPSR